MNEFKIAKQLPCKILVKRILKRVFPKKTISYSNQDKRAVSSDFIIDSLVENIRLTGSGDDTVISNYLQHNFDLLGSGWVNRNGSSECDLNSEHQIFSKKILGYLSEDYKTIDWQLDVKSGFRFDESKAFNKQITDVSKNVDIKNCWELGRLQHLPQLALAASNGFKSEELIIEFKNQVIDFIGSNPIGMGVQWACAMDVGIRVSNILVAYDMFKRIDSKNYINDEFESIMANTVYLHGEFLWNNLEGKEGAAGNHYLFNLVGLLFISNYLSENNRTLEWRRFAEEEIVIEFKKQFFADGGNFEGSTTYHCLSAEAVLYASALMLRNGYKLDNEFTDLFGNCFNFIKDLIKPNGEFPQFGDNDSGRLFKFYPNQNLLNYESLLSGFNALYDIKEDCFVENTIVRQLSNESRLNFSNQKSKNKIKLKVVKHQLQQPDTTEIKFSKAIELDQLEFFSYEDFGVYGFKSKDFYLCISAISNRNMHHSWGHVHNDKLSFDLQIHGVDLMKDPGTYSYTGFPDKRIEMRSSLAHNGIVVAGIDQNKSIGLFYLEREVKCRVLEMKGYSITIEARFYGVIHTRKFTLIADQLIITDYCNKPFRVNINQYGYYSPNYGVIENV